MNIEVTSLISKGGTISLLKNYCLILVLLATYKITAKILANRLQSLISTCILTTQTTFVKSHYILDNVLLSMETIH
jgi:hypothetical protein